MGFKKNDFDEIFFFFLGGLFGAIFILLIAFLIKYFRKY
jgi:hypothetical protein